GGAQECNLGGPGIEATTLPLALPGRVLSGGRATPSGDRRDRPPADPPLPRRTALAGYVRLPRIPPGSRSDEAPGGPAGRGETEALGRGVGGPGGRGDGAVWVGGSRAGGGRDPAREPKNHGVGPARQDPHASGLGHGGVRALDALDVPGDVPLVEAADRP